jgi:LysR family transcriptional regulator, glycine cleavage system transcriptional activator
MTHIPLPSVDALVAFESAARHQSFTRAAAELNLTQGAISRQIRVLEDRLGSSLFQRVRQRVILTDAGRAYLLEVRRILDGLESATLRLMTVGESTNVLNLAVLPAVATHWLLPRLPDFFSKHPGISVNCAIRLSPFDFGTDPFDAAFHYGAPIWAGAVVHHLMDEEIVPVCSPAFKTSRRIRRAEDLTRIPLLHLTTRPAAWADWFAKARIPAANAFQGSLFENFAMIGKAAFAGLGAALLPTYFVEQELKSGTLVAVAPVQRSKSAYYLVIPETKVGTPHVASFVKWIGVQSKSDGHASNRQGVRTRAKKK